MNWVVLAQNRLLITYRSCFDVGVPIYKSSDTRIQAQLIANLDAGIPAVLVSSSSVVVIAGYAKTSGAAQFSVVDPVADTAYRSRIESDGTLSQTGVRYDALFIRPTIRFVYWTPEGERIRAAIDVMNQSVGTDIPIPAKQQEALLDYAGFSALDHRQVAGGDVASSEAVALLPHPDREQPSFIYTRIPTDPAYGPRTAADDELFGAYQGQVSPVAPTPFFNQPRLLESLPQDEIMPLLYGLYRARSRNHPAMYLHDIVTRNGEELSEIYSHNGIRIWQATKAKEIFTSKRARYEETLKHILKAEYMLVTEEEKEQVDSRHDSYWNVLETLRETGGATGSYAQLVLETEVGKFRAYAETVLPKDLVEVAVEDFRNRQSFLLRFPAETISKITDIIGRGELIVKAYLKSTEVLVRSANAERYLSSIRPHIRTSDHPDSEALDNAIDNVLTELREENNRAFDGIFDYLETGGYQEILGEGMSVVAGKIVEKGVLSSSAAFAKAYLAFKTTQALFSWATGLDEGIRFLTYAASSYEIYQILDGTTYGDLRNKIRSQSQTSAEADRELLRGFFDSAYFMVLSAQIMYTHAADAFQAIEDAELGGLYNDLRSETDLETLADALRGTALELNELAQNARSLDHVQRTANIVQAYRVAEAPVQTSPFNLQDDLTTGVPGHDLSLLRFDLASDVVTPGSDIETRFDIRNPGDYTESDYQITLTLEDQGTVIEEVQVSPSIIEPGQVLPVFEERLDTPSDLLDGFYTVTAKVDLSTDEARGDNTVERSVYIGESNPFNTYEYGQDQVVRTGIPADLADGYAIELLAHDSNTARVLVTSDEGYEEERDIERSTIEFFDAYQIAVTYEDYFSSYEGAFTHATPTTDISFSPKRITVEAGRTGRYDVTVNEEDPDPIIKLTNLGLEYAGAVSDWSISPSAPYPPYSNVLLNVTPPTSAERREYTFWTKVVADGQYIQRLNAEVIDSLPDFRYDLSTSTVALGPDADASLSLSLSALNGFDESVRVEMRDLPKGVKSSVSPQLTTAPANIDITLSASGESLSFGYHTTNLVLTSDSRTKTIRVGVNLINTASRFVKITGLRYLDKDARKDSLSIRYDASFDANQGTTVDWSLQIDGQSFPIPASEIAENEPSSAGTDSVLWRIPTDSILFAPEARLQTRVKAGPNRFRSIATYEANADQEFTAAVVSDGVLNVLDDQANRIERYEYANGDFTRISRIPVSVDMKYEQAVYAYGRFYLFDFSSEQVAIYTDDWRPIRTTAGADSWDILLSYKGKLHAINNDDDLIIELDPDGVATGIVYPYPSPGNVDFGFYDGTHVWVGDASTIYKIRPNFDGYERRSLPVSVSDQIAYGGNVIFVTDDNEDLRVLNFKRPYTLPATSPPTTLNNTYTPQLADRYQIVLNEDDAQSDVAGLDTLFVDPDTPTSDLQATIKPSSGLQIDQSGSTISAKPDSNFSGTSSIRLTVSDAYGTTADSISVYVTPENDPPVSTATFSSIELAEDTEFVVPLNQLAEDADHPDSTLLWSADVKSAPGSSLMSKSTRQVRTAIHMGDRRMSERLRDALSMSREASGFAELDGPVRSGSLVRRTMKSRQLSALSMPTVEAFIDLDEQLLRLQAPPDQAAVDSVVVTIRDPENATTTIRFEAVVDSINDPPEAFSLSTPADSAAATDSTVTFQWTTTSDKESKDVEYLFVRKFAGQSTYLDSLTTSDTTLTLPNTPPPDSLGATTEVRWTVVATDGVTGTLPVDVRRSYDAASSPLPVELLDFDGRTDDSVPVLTWSTASETQNAGFHIERRESESRWKAVGFIDGAGTTAEPQTYQYRDESLPFGADKPSYRLRQVDYDGSSTYSSEIIIKRSPPSALVLHGAFPNPARSQITLRYEVVKAGPIRVELFNILGKKVRTVLSGKQTSGRHEQVVDVSRLASGAYFLRLTSDGDTKVKKLTIVR